MIIKIPTDGNGIMLREKDGLDYKNIDENVDATNRIKPYSDENMKNGE